MTIKGFRETRGNDTTEEFWYSPELSIYVERRMNQPRLKESVVVIQIERNDPPAPEFVVPDDYKRVAVSVSAGGPRVQAPGPDGVYQIGRGVSAPQLQYSVDPQYSEEARAEKFQGVCIVGVTVDTHGEPRMFTWLERWEKVSIKKLSRRYSNIASNRLFTKGAPFRCR